MARFDWNGNGKKDKFDTYIEMKVISSVSKDDKDNSDYDYDDVETTEDFNFDIEGIKKTKVAQTSKVTQNQNMPLWRILLAIVIVFVAFIICLNANIGKLGMGLLLIGSVIIGSIILMKQ